MEGSIVRLREGRKEQPDVSLALAAREAIRPVPFGDKAREIVPLLRDRAMRLAPVVKGRAKDFMKLVNAVKPFAISIACGITGSIALLDLSTFNNGKISGSTLISVAPIVFGSSAMAYKYSKKQQLKERQNQNNLERLRSEPVPRETQYSLSQRGTFEQRVALLINPATSIKTINTIKRNKKFCEELWKAFSSATDDVRYYEQKLSEDPKNPFFEKQLRRIRTDVGFYDEAMVVLDRRAHEIVSGPAFETVQFPVKNAA